MKYPIIIFIVWLLTVGLVAYDPSKIHSWSTSIFIFVLCVYSFISEIQHRKIMKELTETNEFLEKIMKVEE